MPKSASLYREGNSVSAGARAAVLVVVLAGFAAAVDHFSAHPNGTTVLAHVAPPVAVVSTVAEPIVFPAELRAHEGEIPALVATF